MLPQFVEGLQRAYPGIEFTDVNKQKGVDLDCRIQTIKNGLLHVPLRWSREIMNVPYNQVMNAKYEMYGYDWKEWRKHAMWVRDEAKERELFYEFLKLKDDEEFTLVNQYYRSDNSGVVGLKLPGKTVDMKTIPGFSIFDWALAMERAKELHFVSSASLYILEMLELKQPIHLYKRLPEEMNFKNVQFLFTKPYILH